LICILSKQKVILIFDKQIILSERIHNKGDTMKQLIGQVSHIYKNIWFLLSIALKQAPFFSIYLIISPLLLQLIIFVEHTYMIAYLIDCVQYQKSFVNALLFIIAVFFLSVVHSIVSRFVYDIIAPKAAERINREIRCKLYNKTCNLDLECYDSPDFYNDYVWAMEQANTRIYEVIDTVGNALGTIGIIFVIAGYILSSEKLGIVISIGTFITSTIFSLVINKKNFFLDNDMRPAKRKSEYIHRVFYLADFAKEIRMSDIKNKLYQNHKDAMEKQKDIVDKQTKPLFFLSFLKDFICNKFLYEGFYLLYLAYITIVKKVLSYGTMVALFNSVQNLSNSLLQISQLISQFQGHSLYIDKIKKILEYKEKIVDGPKSLPYGTTSESLELKNVSFGYGDKMILKNINLVIHPGERIALVGYNGAGKTTLIKLILRLYDPEAGTILYDGNDICEYKLSDYRSLFGTIFQDYQLFSATLGENIVMAPSEIDPQRAKISLKESGFYDKYITLINGYETQLTNEFYEDGIGLSGGESQKLAIARCLYKDSRILIMDEPSSALDPYAEYLMNNTILQVASGKTIIIISHRLTTTKMVDRILMLDHGEIVEQGSHDELMRQNGQYARMFHLQSSLYTD